MSEQCLQPQIDTNRGGHTAVNNGRRKACHRAAPWTPPSWTLFPNKVLSLSLTGSALAGVAPLLVVLDECLGVHEVVGCVWVLQPHEVRVSVHQERGSVVCA